MTGAKVAESVDHVSSAPPYSRLHGRALPPTAPYLVGREKVREFSRSVFASKSIHYDLEAAQAAGYRDVVAPPTFAVVLQEVAVQQLLLEPDVSIDYARVLHSSQRFLSIRPIVVGDELVANLSVTSVRVISGNTMMALHTKISGLDGELVVAADCTLLVRNSV
jgi:acyl dehydratase